MYTVPRRLWQVAGALALAHVALIPAGLALQQGPLFADGRQGIIDSYATADITTSFTGGILEAFGFVLFLVVLAFLGRVLGHGSDTGRWGAQVGVLAGVAYASVVFAVGFPAGAAAMYGTQHGLDVDAAFALNNVRLFAHFLSMMLLGASTLGFAVAALAGRTHPRWFGAFGLVTGVALMVSPPLTPLELQDLGSMVWIVWFVGVGVLMLRHHDPAATEVAGSSRGGVVVGHS